MISQYLLAEIFVRLPLKSLARCRCVSKLWASVIRSQYFIKLYQSQSLSRQPCVMLAFGDISSCRWFFVSSVQPPCIVTNSTCYIDNSYFHRPECVNGLICVEHIYRLRICNPISGKMILLPQSDPSKLFTSWYMGYDPINYQYKILYFSKESFNDRYKVEVFTMGDQGSWKTIEDENFQNPQSRGICLDGIVYYKGNTMHGPRIVGFNVITEKFVNFIEIPTVAHGMNLGFVSLMNYHGKLAILDTITINIYDLWVLEDAEKEEWSKVSICITEEMGSFKLIWPGVVGFVPGSGEAMVTAYDGFGHFVIVYVDLKMNRSRKAWFQGLRCSYHRSSVLTFTDFVESIMLA